MIILITAIAPEAQAVRAELVMKQVPVNASFLLYEGDGIRLLVTGYGKVHAAIALAEYLILYPPTDTDVFCNVGICGSFGHATKGDGFLCASVTELTTGTSILPELYRHPFQEACLFTSDVPITDSSELFSIYQKQGHQFPNLPDISPDAAAEALQPLPYLVDMEAFGCIKALGRTVSPERIFIYKIVSDLCDGATPNAAEVTNLVRPHLARLLSFLKEQEALLCADTSTHTTLPAFYAEISEQYPFSVTMKRRLQQLLRYGELSDCHMADFLSAYTTQQNDSSSGKVTKKQAISFLQDLEDFLLTGAASTLESAQHGSSVAEHGNRVLRPTGRVYVERDILNHPTTQRILKHLPGAFVIPIRHYKDIFNRGKQNTSRQKNEPAFILAANRGTLMYPGAPVCQSFGEEHFMYTSCIMNCIYDCDYCYLQGMYPSGNIVVFVNLEDYFAELDALLEKHPVYLCCSYDSDLTALNGLFPHAEEFCRYAAEHKNLRLELRTKSAALPFIKQLPAAKNIVIAFTLSPQEMISRYEHYTPSLKARLATAKEAANRGFSLRLCFDPILDVPNAETLYATLVEEVFSVLTPDEITDISLGVFRLSKDYLKQLKKAKPMCAISHYPYELTDGVCHYRIERCNELLDTVREALHHHDIPDDKIFIWAPEESKEGEPHVN